MPDIDLDDLRRRILAVQAGTADPSTYTREELTQALQQIRAARREKSLTNKTPSKVDVAIQEESPLMAKLRQLGG